MRTRARLSLRQAALAMAIAVVLGFVISLGQIGYEFFKTRESLEETVAGVLQTLEAPAIEAAYHLNRTTAASVVEGLFRFPSIHHAVLYDNFGDVLAERRRPLKDSALRSLAEHIVASDREYALDLFAPEVGQVVGRLVVQADASAAARGMAGTSVLILALGIVKNILLAAVLAFAFFLTLTKPLVQLWQKVKAIDPGAWPAGRVVLPGLERPDEIGDLALATNRLIEAARDHQQRAQEEANERRRAEEALHERESRIQRLVDSNIIGIFFWNLAGDITAANDALLDIVGYSREDLDSGQVGWAQMTPAEYRAADEQAAAEIEAQGSCRPYEKEFVRKDGSRVLVLIGATLLEGSRDEGVAFVLDLTERKRAEAERQARQAAEAANRAKSEFLANMSHELRSPLNTILGFARLMVDEPVPDALREDLATIVKSGEHLHALINQVLDLSKLEAGRTTLQRAEFDLEMLLDDLKDLFTPRAVDKGLQLIFTPRRDVPRHVRTDPVKLRQVLINLIDNALKFTAEGSVVLRVEATQPDGADQCRIRFAVTDTGSGIAEDELAHLFGAFAQTEAGRQSREGTGLGLAISRGFVRLMGGELQVASIAGSGTTFHFDVPVDVIHLAQPNGETKRHVVGLAPGEPRHRMLVVDDQAEARQLLLRLLAPLGCELEEAANGQEAIDLWRQWQPDLIWMDLRMPVLDGREAARRIKEAANPARTEPDGNDGDRAQSAPRQRDAPASPVIIAMTASVFEEEQTDVLRAGCDDFLRKPFLADEVFALMEKHLGAHFIYEEAPTSTPFVPDPAAVAALPAALRASLAHALIRLDADEVNRSIQAIAEADARLGKSLAALAADFQYERLLSVIQADDASSPETLREPNG